MNNKHHVAVVTATALAFTIVSSGAIRAASAFSPNTGSIQRFIDQAPSGGTVVVPPGIYLAGARISKPLTVRLRGVRIFGNTAGKAIISVVINGGPVVIEDFTTTNAGTVPAAIARA